MARGALSVTRDGGGLLRGHDPPVALLDPDRHIPDLLLERLALLRAVAPCTGNHVFYSSSDALFVSWGAAILCWCLSTAASEDLTPVTSTACLIIGGPPRNP